MTRLETEKPWEGGVTRHFVSGGPGLNRAVSVYLDGIRDGRPREAMDRYTGDTYIQHSTGVADGKAGFIEFFDAFLKRNPQRDIRVIRAIEDGPYVFLHAFQDLNAGAAQWVTMDIFRLDEAQRIVEHWDVIAPYCARTVSGRSSIDGPTEVGDLDRTEANRRTVRELIESGLTADSDPAVVDRLVADDCRVHDRDAPDGRVHLRPLDASEERALVYQEVVLLVAQGNFVAALSKATRDGEPQAQCDLFRLEEGRIVEHWDAAEPAMPSDLNGGKF